MADELFRSDSEVYVHLRKKHRGVRRRTVLFIVLGIILVMALLIELQLTWLQEKSNAQRTTSIFLEQVESVFDANDQHKKEHIQELKETYISYAQNIAYILSAKPDAIRDIEELKQIARYQHADELYIFNEKGVIISGTVPKNVGLSFDSGEQIGFFKPMLKDKSLTMCQDITPNTAEGKSMMYAITWDRNGSCMIQIGVEPKRILNEIAQNRPENVIRNIFLPEGFDIYTVEPNTGKVLASTNPSVVGSDMASDYITRFRDSKSLPIVGIIKSNGKHFFCCCRKHNDILIAVSFIMETNLGIMMQTVCILAAFLLFAGTVIAWLYLRLDRADEANRRQLIDLAAARKAAESANRAKTAFLFSMSHDIRTPMNAILGYAELIGRNPGDHEKCADYLKKLTDSGKFLLSLINNVLEMARIDSGKTELHETQTATGTVSRQVASIYSELMKEKGLVFTNSVDVKTPFIWSDQVKISEIFLNIVSNAYKYTPAGGRVSYRQRELPSPDPGMTVIETTVSDTGIGMAKEFLPKLFEEFSREYSTTEAGIHGTGLGMPIVKKLIELMHGTITVESEPGKGTTFVVTIPHRIAEAPAFPEEPKVSHSENRLQGKRILLAEDNDLNAEIAAELLSDAGISCERANDGIICVDMLQKSQAGYYDLILMDIQMPNLDGYGAAKRIRALSDLAKANIPIIAMTANAFDEDKRNAFAAGMNGHVGKPIDLGKLTETISEILG